MGFFQITAALLTLSAVLAYINLRFIRLPMMIGVMLLSLIASLALIAVGKASPGAHDYAAEVLSRIDFEQLVLHGILCLMLFAGSLHVNLNDLYNEKAVVSLLATFGVVLSTLIVGFTTFGVLRLLDLNVALISCLLLGALISPTDPIAVLAILKSASAPKSLEVQLAGESLFNDGIGVVVFLTMLEISHGSHIGATDVIRLITTEVLGGAALGACIGGIGFLLLRRIDHYQVEVLITVAIATGGYALAEALHLSAPIAIVVEGLLIGNQGRALAMSDETRQNLDTFWTLIDEILNAILFVLIGLQVLVMPFTGSLLLVALIVIPIILLARFVGVGSVYLLLKKSRTFARGTVPILVWAGLRGGLSVAMAVSLPLGHAHDVIVAITYIVVIFSIVVQGLTIKPLLKRFAAMESPCPAAA